MNRRHLIAAGCATIAASAIASVVPIVTPRDLRKRAAPLVGWKQEYDAPWAPVRMPDWVEALPHEDYLDWTQEEKDRFLAFYDDLPTYHSDGEPVTYIIANDAVKAIWSANRDHRGSAA